MSDQQQAPHPTAAVCVDNGTFVPQAAPVISRVRATEEETAALAQVGQPTEEPRDTSHIARGPFYEPTTGWWDARRQQIEQPEAQEAQEPEPEPEQPKRGRRR